MAISIFNTRTMLAALEELRTPNTFLLRKFFRTQVECVTESVDIDVYKGKRRVAVYVNPRAVGQTVDRAGYTTYTYKPPYVKPKMATTAEDMLKRLPGEVLYANNISNEQRAAIQLGKDMVDLDAIITRAEELQAKQALFDSKIEVHDIEGNEVVADITFPREASHTVDLTATGETAWDETGSYKLKNIRDWRRLNLKDSGISSDVVILGSDSADVFLADKEVRDSLNKDYAGIGQIIMEAQELGVTYLGRFEGIDYYSYDEWYVDPVSGVESAIVPAKKVLVGSTNARCERVYGAIRDIEAGLAAVARFPKTWVENDPSVRWLQIHSAPLCVPVQVDAFTVATVLS